MGFLSSIISKAKKVGGEVVGAVVGTASLLTGQGKEKSIQTAVDVSKTKVAQNLGAVVVGSTAAASGVAVATTPALLGAFKSFGSSVLSFAKDKPIAAAGTALAVGFGIPLIASSEKAQSVVSKIPSQISNIPQAGSDVGDWIDNPSLAKLEKIAKENPLLLSLIAAAVVVAGGKALQIYNQWKQTQLAKENIGIQEEILEIQKNPTLPTTPSYQPKPTEKIIQTDASTPDLPETIRVSPTQTKRRKRSTRTKQPLNITQRTNILINNTNSGTKLKTRKYLNAKIIENSWSR
jgi:hypothetical protein